MDITGITTKTMYAIVVIIETVTSGSNNIYYIKQSCMDLDKSNPSNLDLDLDWIWTGFGFDFDFVLGLDWILDSKYFMDLDMDLDLKVPWIWIWTWIH